MALVLQMEAAAEAPGQCRHVLPMEATAAAEVPGQSRQTRPSIHHGPLAYGAVGRMVVVGQSSTQYSLPIRFR